MAWKSCIACFFDMTLSDVAHIVKSSPYAIITAAASVGHKNWPFTSIKEGKFSMSWEDVAELRSRHARKAKGELASMLCHAQRTGRMRRCIHENAPVVAGFPPKRRYKKKKKAAFTPHRKKRSFCSVVLEAAPPGPKEEPVLPERTGEPMLPMLPERTGEPMLPMLPERTGEPMLEESAPRETAERRVLRSSVGRLAKKALPPVPKFQAACDPSERVPAGYVRVFTPLEDCLPTEGLEPVIWDRKAVWLSWE